MELRVEGQNKVDRGATKVRSEAYFSIRRSDELRSNKGMRSYDTLYKKSEAEEICV